MKRVKLLALVVALACSGSVARAGFWDNIACSISEVLGGLFCAAVETVDLGLDVLHSLSYNTQNGAATATLQGWSAAGNEWINDVFTDSTVGSTVFNQDGTKTVTFDGDAQSCWNEANPIDDCDW